MNPMHEIWGMSFPLRYAISLLVADTPWYFIACVPFRGSERIPKKYVTVLLIAFAFIRMAMGYAVARYTADWQTWNTYSYLLITAILLAAYIFCYKIDFSKLLYTMLILLLLASAAACMSHIIVAPFLPGRGSSLIAEPAWILTTAVLVAGTFPFVYRLFNTYLRPAFSELSSKSILTFCAAPALFHIMYNVFIAMRGIYTDIIISFFIVSVGVVLSFTNLQLIQYTKESLAQKSALQTLDMKTKFLQDISHEMKAPLTVIATGIDFADQEMKAEDGSLADAGGALETIRAETLRLGRMVDGMAKLASINEISENRTRISFAALLRDNAEAFRYKLEQQGVILTAEAVPGIPDVFIEKDKFSQVLANLLLNAAEHTKQGRITVTADFDDEYITVRVADTGEGVSPDMLPHIFERGVSGRGSTGYGLYICRTVVEAHGGTIGMESEPGKGCAVTFTVPVYGGQEVGCHL